MMRDAALSSSLLLNHTIGGLSVKPYQPDGLWSISALRIEEIVAITYIAKPYTLLETNQSPTLDVRIRRSFQKLLRSKKKSNHTHFNH